MSRLNTEPNLDDPDGLFAALMDAHRDLDDADRLASLGLRPPRVVTRDREVTQAWARELFEGGQYAGVRWWSYYNPDWGSVGLWDSAALHVTDVVTLTVDHPAFVAAAAEIIRIIE
ncbi:MAG: DUF2783 domain-containing protein [Rhodospirillales bacterium]|nr:DUF2783 domain-containing protein [Rhodospirillales bacterium]